MNAISYAEDLEPKDTLPIVAATFPLKVISRSNSNETYLFEDGSLHQPLVGRIILLKNEKQTPVMALRVIKTYPNAKMLAARTLKNYTEIKLLEADQTFLAVEKISDILPPPPVNQDAQELKEIEETRGKVVFKNAQPTSDLESLQPKPSPSPSPQTVDGVDEEKLKAAKSSAPPDEVKKASDEDGLESDESSNLQESKSEVDRLGSQIDEIRPFDSHRHWLGVGFAYLRNRSQPLFPGFTYYSSGSIRYGIDLSKNVFFHTNRIQDSLTLELGTGFYKILSYAVQTDSYNLMSVTPTLRYNLFLSPNLGVFLYAGITQSIVFSSLNSSPLSLMYLNSLLPSFGGGILFQIGPGWYTRLDAGIDTVGLSLILRF